MLHRQSVILRNEFHAQNDGLGFKSWVSPEQTNIWDITTDWNLYEDDKAILKKQHNLKTLATLARIIDTSIELLQRAVNELKELKRIRCGQSISSLVEWTHLSSLSSS